MILLAILGLCLVGGAIACAIWAFVMPRNRALPRLESIDAYGFAAKTAPVVLPGDGRQAPLSLAARRLGDLFVERFGSARLD
jgi:hypothetical protein